MAFFGHGICKMLLQAHADPSVVLTRNVFYETVLHCTDVAFLPFRS